MPRTKIGANPAAHIAANIAYYAQMYGYDGERIAAVLHVSASTWYHRKSHPEKFTVEELQRLANSFNISLSDLILRRDNRRDKAK